MQPKSIILFFYGYILFFRRQIKLKNVLKHEINFTKKTNQKIVASWKYCQEFEKMCKELDGDIYEKDL